MTAERSTESKHARWVSEALSGDDRALGSIVGLLTPVVRARVSRALGRYAGGQQRDARTEVDDLSQEVFLSLFADGGRLLRTWDPERGLSLCNYVGLLATRLVLSTFRSPRRNPWSELPEDPVTIIERGQAVSHGERILSRQLLVRLADELRSRLSPYGLQMFYRLYVWEHPTSTISEETGLSLDAVYQWRARLGKHARQILTELESEQQATDQPEGLQPTIGADTQRKSRQKAETLRQRAHATEETKRLFSVGGSRG